MEFAQFANQWKVIILTTSIYSVLLINKIVDTGHHETYAIFVNEPCTVNERLYGVLLEVLV